MIFLLVLFLYFKLIINQKIQNCWKEKWISFHSSKDKRSLGCILLYHRHIDHTLYSTKTILYKIFANNWFSFPWHIYSSQTKENYYSKLSFFFIKFLCLPKHSLFFFLSLFSLSVFEVIFVIFYQMAFNIIG